jgi:arginine decarboxylase
VSKYPARYRDTTLRELSDEMHLAMIELNLSGLVNEACDEDFDPVLTPAQAYQKLLRNETEKIPFHEMAGRIAAVMLVPYPPGIPMSMPGERLGGPESPVVKLILAMQEFGKRFPGFEREVHGVELDADGNYWMRGVIEKPAKGRKKAAAGAKQPRKKKAPREIPHLEPEPVGAGWQR